MVLLVVIVIIVGYLQALLCYLPHWLWTIWEGGLMKSLVMGMNHGLKEEEEVSKKKGMLMNYLLSHIKVGPRYSTLRHSPDQFRITRVPSHRANFSFCQLWTTFQGFYESFFYF